MIERFMLNEELEEKVGEITGIDYTGMLKVEDIENMIKDLITEYHRLEEKIDDLQQELRSNPVEISPYEEYDINEKDFH